MGTDPARPPDAAAPPVPYEQLVRVHLAAARLFRGWLAGSWVPAYLAGRGIDAPTQRRWHTGYAPAGWDGLARDLRALGYSEAVIEAAGLARRSSRGTAVDTFRDRAVLPIRDSAGVIVAFIGRAPDRAAPGVPKYLNSPATRLYRKREILFGLWEGRGALGRGARPVIVEGPFDVIAVTAAGRGRFAGVSPCGTTLTAAQIASLARFCELPTAGVLTAFDPDEAGRRAAVAAYHLLISRTDALTAAVLPAGCDPARIMRDDGPAMLAHLLANSVRPLADLVVDAEVGRWSRWLCYAEGQLNALRAAAPLIAAMPPSHVAGQVARLAHRLGLDYATVTGAVTDALAAVISHPDDAAPPRADTAAATRPWRGQRCA